MRKGGTLSKLKVLPTLNTDTKIGGYVERFDRRVDTTPPGQCPLTVQVALLDAGCQQTCGKCVTCRDGLPQLRKMLAEIAACQADASVLEAAKVLATMIRDTSDCAIGYQAAQDVLDGMETFAAEYASHVENHSCQEEVGQTVPCESLCPAHVNVPGYIALVGQGDYSGAIQMIRKDNPFPTACAFVCEHPCELRCRRTLLDAPVNIRGIKKFAVDQFPADKAPVPARGVDTGRSIAVIGGGPSGLTCAYFLALMGHKVTLFEEKAQLGGMMRYGIPAYRFPRERLDEDIRAILSVGNIDVRLNAAIGTQEMERICATYDAAYVAIGAHVGNSIRLDHEDAPGVSFAVDMLRAIGDGQYPDYTGKKVAIIGGGNVAMDCCRTAIRCGAAEVNCIYRRRLEDMTALLAEVESAMQEGVEMLTLQSPVGIELDESGHCCAVVTQPQRIGAVRGGRPAPVNANKPQNRIEADIVLIASGQGIVSGPFEEFGMEANRGRFVANEYLEAAGYENIFVGGDCQTGPATVIRAIGAGKVAARNIDEFLGYHHTLNCDVEAPQPKENDRTAYGRVNIAERPARQRRADFDAVEEEMSLEEAQQECGRCLRCDHYG
ncbi:MAG: NAD(P)-binding protein, partial [Eggerthellales bacterium]|nr:NAD(P)-binding protein [Eggerthellales bacterium]